MGEHFYFDLPLCVCILTEGQHSLSHFHGVPLAVNSVRAVDLKCCSTECERNVRQLQ